MDDASHNVVLVRDPTTAMESILRRFWNWDAEHRSVDTLAREETFFDAAHSHRATLGSFNAASTREVRDHVGVKKNASTLRETLKRDDHLGPNRMSL